MTAQQEARVTKEWSRYAKEPVRVERVGSAIYGFGSELAVLRLFAKFSANGAVHCKHSRVGFSSNLDSWYFSLETPLLEGNDSAP